MQKAKLLRASTIALSLDVLLRGQLKYLNEHLDVTAVSGPDEHLNAVQGREGVRILPLRFERQISPFKDLVSLIKLYFLLRREKPDIIHSITPKAGLLSMLAGKAAGVPIRMHTFTGLVFPTRTGAMQKILIAMDRLLCWAA
ncbi:MAG: glycosyltransferase family 1 protein, partial [Chryseobacterium sp.]